MQQQHLNNRDLEYRGSSCSTGNSSLSVEFEFPLLNNSNSTRPVIAISLDTSGHSSVYTRVFRYVYSTTVRTQYSVSRFTEKKFARGTEILRSRKFTVATAQLLCFEWSLVEVAIFTYSGFSHVHCWWTPILTCCLRLLCTWMNQKATIKNPCPQRCHKSGQHLFLRFDFANTVTV